MTSERDAAAERAAVVTTFGREMSLRRKSGEIVRARIKGRKLKPVCGDWVRAQPLSNEPEWIITAIEPRNNELTRPNLRGQTEILAANIDFLCVVAAAKPAADWFVVDRYLCAAELMNVDAAVVFNKTDLAGADRQVKEALADYRSLGYAIAHCSAKTGEGIAQLAELLANRTSIIVGQSGVGKSSLINRLTGDDARRISEISSATGEGRHTTVNSSMLPLEGGGDVIDSPGVRDYAPAIRTTDQVIRGFKDIRDAGQRCRFANCRHTREPNCAVKESLAAGSIGRRRYDSYRRLLVMSQQQQKKYS